MISLEILIPEPAFPVNLDFAGGYDLDVELKSDRSPSKWQMDIFDKCRSGLLLHIFDRSFIKNQEQRWLYSDIDEFKEGRFKFAPELELSFLKLIYNCIVYSKTRTVILTTDAQWGNDKKYLNKMSFEKFSSIYPKHGIGINYAIPIFSI